MSAITEQQRKLEALLFAATEPLDLRTLLAYLGSNEECREEVKEDLKSLQNHYQ